MHYRLAHKIARERALNAVRTAPDGWVVTVKEQTRNSEQNALLWVLLECFSRQLDWPVNGRMAKLEPADWKDLLTAAFRQETRVADGISGGVVMLGARTSKMGVREFAEFIAFIQAVAADRGVDIGG